MLTLTQRGENSDMKILVVASELAPFAKTGGLGDVLGALPKALASLGHEVKTFIPHYGSIDENVYSLVALDWSLAIPVDQRRPTMDQQRM